MNRRRLARFRTLPDRHRRSLSRAKRSPPISAAIAAPEIEQFKTGIRSARGETAEKITDEDLLREVMNTSASPGRLGETGALRGLGLDADRGLGRQHGHPHPRRARLRYPAPLRAGRRPRVAPPILRSRSERDVPAVRICQYLRRPVLVRAGRPRGDRLRRPSRRARYAVPERAELSRSGSRMSLVTG